MYIQQKCTEPLKEYFMGLSFDTANTVTDKIDEIKELFNTNQVIQIFFFFYKSYIFYNKFVNIYIKKLIFICSKKLIVINF